MGYSRNIYIADEEVEKRLQQEKNPSKLIVTLLRDYYDLQKLKELSTEEIERHEKVLIAQLNFIKEKQKIENGN